MKKFVYGLCGFLGILGLLIGGSMCVIVGWLIVK